MAVETYKNNFSIWFLFYYFLGLLRIVSLLHKTLCLPSIYFPTLTNRWLITIVCKNICSPRWITRGPNLGPRTDEGKPRRMTNIYGRSRRGPFLKCHWERREDSKHSYLYMFVNLVWYNCVVDIMFLYFFRFNGSFLV